MKDELCAQIMKEVAALRAKAYKYSTDNNNEDEKSSRHKTCVVKRNRKFEVINIVKKPLNFTQLAFSFCLHNQISSINFIDVC